LQPPSKFEGLNTAVEISSKTKTCTRSSSTIYYAPSTHDLIMSLAML
jgi:hypothetical protein